MTGTERHRPLEGIRIIDFSQVEFGPIATQFLADFGADVIKIERPGVGDLSRALDQRADIDGGPNAIFSSLNRNKRSATLDMRSAAGKSLARRMVLRSDVLVHNFRPGVIERFGLGWEDLRQDHPRIIHASGSGFGESGPLASRGGQDMLAQSMSGVAHHARTAEGRPVLHPVAFADFGAGMVLVQGVLLGLFARERTGLGLKVHVNLLDVMLTAQMQELTQWRLRGEELNFVSQYLAGVFRAADGWVTMVGLFRHNPLRVVCEALDMDDLSARPEFSTDADQLANRAALFALLDEGFSRYTVEECLRRLGQRDLLCAPVADYEAVVAHPQVLHNGMLVELGPDRLPTVGNPVHIDGTPPIPLEQPPALGAHTEAVLREVLDLNDGQIEQARAAGAFGSR